MIQYCVFFILIVVKNFSIRDVKCTIPTEVDTKSPGNAKTLRITVYTQNWGRLPKVGLGLVPGLLVSTSVSRRLFPYWDT